MRPIHLVPTSLLRATSEIAVPAALSGHIRYLEALRGADHLKTRLLTFDSGWDMLAAAVAVGATEVCIPLEYEHLGLDVRDAGFEVVPVVWDYHDPECFLVQYEIALSVAEKLGATKVAIAQPRCHDKAAIHGVLRYCAINQAVLSGLWSRQHRHYLFGGFNPAEPVVYRSQFSGFVRASIVGFVSGIMFRSILYGQVFSNDFGLYDRAIDDMWEYRVSLDHDVADYHLTPNQYALWNRNMDTFMGFFKGSGGAGLLEYARWEVANEG